MKSKKLDEFNDQIIEKALGYINQDALAKRLAKELEKKIKTDFDEVINDRLDMSEWLLDELTNPKTDAGKSFAKAIGGITSRMANAVSGK